MSNHVECDDCGELFDSALSVCPECGSNVRIVRTPPVEGAAPADARVDEDVTGECWKAVAVMHDPIPAVQSEVSELMVERACDAFCAPVWDQIGDEDKATERQRMRRALRAALLPPAGEARGEWVSVEDRLPPPLRRVLCWFAGEPGDGEWAECFHDGNRWLFSDPHARGKHVTHWREPSPPAARKEPT